MNNLGLTKHKVTRRIVLLCGNITITAKPTNLINQAWSYIPRRIETLDNPIFFLILNIIVLKHQTPRRIS